MNAIRSIMAAYFFVHLVAVIAGWTPIATHVYLLAAATAVAANVGAIARDMQKEPHEPRR